MGSYYEHKRTESVNLPYSFRCEHCMSDSGPLWATVTGSGTKNSIMKEVNQKDEEKMRKEAHKDLVRTLGRLHKDIVEKQAFTAIFTDECPHCHKPQSWGISIAKEGMIAGPLAFLIFGIFLGGCGMFLQKTGDVDYMTPPVVAGIVALGALAAAANLGWNIIKVNKKKKMLATSVQKNLPVIQWEAVQYLLNEQ